MQLHLIDHRRNLCIEAKIGKPIRIEIGDANCTNLARLIEFLHRAPCAVIVVKGLMDQIEIQIIQPQLIHGDGERLLRALIARILHP